MTFSVDLNFLEVGIARSAVNWRLVIVKFNVKFLIAGDRGGVVESTAVTSKANYCLKIQFIIIITRGNTVNKTQIF